MTTMISMADSELTLANIALDLQITICIFLGPIDILALRKVCHQSIHAGSFGCSSRWWTYRLVKLLNLLHGNVQFGWLRFIEYASTTLFFYQVSPYPIWVIWNSNKLRWRRIGGLSSVAGSRNGIMVTLAGCYAHEQLELLEMWPCTPYQKSFSCQVDDSWWSLRLIVFSFGIWDMFQMPIAH